MWEGVVLCLALIATVLLVLTVRDMIDFTVTGVVDLIPSAVAGTIAFLLWYVFYLMTIKP